MITRKAYLNKEAAHREYYAQFVNPSILGVVKRFIGVERIKKALKEDKHLNVIPLKKWDSLPVMGVAAKLREAGDYLTAAGNVCILKEAARQLAEA